MRKIYIDNDYKCHTRASMEMLCIETDFFNGKCTAFIEGYRFVPEGQTWTREDGMVFHGEMITPWKSYTELDIAQRTYEHDLAQAAQILLGEE